MFIIFTLLFVVDFFVDLDCFSGVVGLLLRVVLCLLLVVLF